jgi:hypothetical protein
LQKSVADDALVGLPFDLSPKGMNMRPEHDTRQTVIREWMSLPRDRRQSKEQVAAFATQAMEKHSFTYSGDRHAKIMAWLLPRIAKPHSVR